MLDPDPVATVRRVVPVSGRAVDTVGNVVLFVPVGVLARLALVPRPAVLALLACVSLGVGFELVQLLFTQRNAEFSDVGFTAVGAAIGVILAVAGGHVMARRARPDG